MLNGWCIALFIHRFVASFIYYGSVLSSSELLEKNLLCVTDANPEHQIKHKQDEALCYCIPFNMADYQTLLISCLGEVAREWPLTSHSPPVSHTPLSWMLKADVCVSSAVIPLNITLLNVFGRKPSMAILLVLCAVFFMLVNICTTMWVYCSLVP